MISNKFFSFYLFILFAALGCIYSATLLAQGNDEGSKSHLAGEVYIPILEYAGNQHYIEEWLLGKVVLVNGEIITNQKLKYNGLVDEVIWLEPFTNQQIKLDKNLISNFSITSSSTSIDETFEFVKWDSRFPQAYGLRNTYLHQLHRGPISLYSKRQIRETSRMESVYIGGRGQLRILIAPSYTYYLLLPQNNVREVKLNRSDFISAVTSNGRFLRREMRRSRIRVKTEQDMVNALIWFEVLKSKYPDELN
jgi:hypothetical protein